MATTKPSSLESHLQTLLPSEARSSLRKKVLPALLQSISQVAKILRSESTVSQVGTSNSFGDDQLNVDVLAEEEIRSAIADCSTIFTASSEEDPLERSKSSCISNDEDGDEQYTLAFDPLDGSSIIGPNWTVGTIIGIWDGSTALNQSPEKQIAAILGVYGPRTTAVCAVRIPGSEGTCFEVGFGSQGEVEVVRSNILLNEAPFKTRYFAPANLRSAADDSKYMSLITHFIAQKYTLRYSGGFVPDIIHALVKGHGVYISPVTEKSGAKLRKLYELLPVALIIECVGGLAFDSATGERILEKQVGDTNERGGLICGTKEEVESVKKALLS